MLTRLTSLVILVVALPPFLWVAWLLWENDSSRNSAKPLVEKKEIPSLVIEPLSAALRSELRSVNADVAFMRTVVEAYVNRKPLDPQGWLWLSEFCFRAGDSETANQALSVAHALSKQNATLLMRVFNRYLELGLIDQALPVAHDLVMARPENFRRLFYLMSRLSTDYGQIVDKMIPKAVPAGKCYSDDMFFSRAIQDSIRAKNEVLAGEVWEGMPSEMKIGSKASLSYLDFVAELQKPKLFKAVWNDMFEQDIVVDSLPAFDLSGVSACWRRGEIEGTGAVLDDRGASDTNSMMIEFTGKSNIQFYHLSCLLLVEPETGYRLSAMWAGDNVTTFSGPYIGVYAPGVAEFRERSDMMTGTWPWKSLEVDFKPPQGVSIVKVLIRRDKTSFLDSKIAGRVWFDDFKLARTSELSQAASGQMLK